MRGAWSGLVIVSALLMLGGCTRATQMIRASSEAEKLTADVHLAMARGDWQSIYRNADPELRDAVSEEKFGAMMIAVEETFGSPVSSKQTSWKMDTDKSGTHLRAECDTTFQKNVRVTESLEWKKSDNGYKLAQYRIDSAKKIK